MLDEVNELEGEVTVDELADGVDVEVVVADDELAAEVVEVSVELELEVVAEDDRLVAAVLVEVVLVVVVVTRLPCRVKTWCLPLVGMETNTWLLFAPLRFLVETGLMLEPSKLRL